MNLMFCEKNIWKNTKKNLLNMGQEYQKNENN